RLIVGGVEPVAARGALRCEERVAALPCAEEVGADAGAPRELTDANRGICHAAEHSRWTHTEQGLDKVAVFVLICSGLVQCLSVHFHQGSIMSTITTARRGPAALVAGLAALAVAAAPANR